MEEDSSDMQRYTARYYQILVVLQPPTNCSGHREVLARILPDLAEKMGEIVVRSPVEIRWLADENSREESSAEAYPARFQISQTTVPQGLDPSSDPSMLEHLQQHPPTQFLPSAPEKNTAQPFQPILFSTSPPSAAICGLSLPACTAAQPPSRE